MSNHGSTEAWASGGLRKAAAWAGAKQHQREEKKLSSTLRKAAYALVIALVLVGAGITFWQIRTVHERYSRNNASTNLVQFFSAATANLRLLEDEVSNYLEDMRAYFGATFRQVGGPPTYDAWLEFPKSYAKRSVFQPTGNNFPGMVEFHGTPPRNRAAIHSHLWSPRWGNKQGNETSSILFFYSNRSLEGDSLGDMIGVDLASDPRIGPSLEAAAQSGSMAVSSTVEVSDTSFLAVYASKAVYREPRPAGCWPRVSPTAPPPPPTSECIHGHVSVEVRINLVLLSAGGSPIEQIVAPGTGTGGERADTMHDSIVMRLFKQEGDGRFVHMLDHAIDPRNRFAGRYPPAADGPHHAHGQSDIDSHEGYIHSAAEHYWGGVLWRLEMYADVEHAASSGFQESSPVTMATLVCVFLVILALVAVGAYTFELQFRLRLRHEEVLHEYAAAREEVMRSSRVKEEFLANMSHEIRTPINGIVGVVELLSSEGGGAGEDFEDGVKTLRACSDALMGVVDGILDWNKIAGGKMQLRSEEFSLEDLELACASEVEERVEEAGLKLVRGNHLRDGSVVVGDFGRLQQVVSNLLSNACKFTPRGGVVGLSMTLADEGPAGMPHPLFAGEGAEGKWRVLSGSDERLQVHHGPRDSAQSAHSSGVQRELSTQSYASRELSTIRAEMGGVRGGEPAWIVVVVSDTGIGMDEGTQERLFTAFMQADTTITRKYGGTGLGLAIVQMLLLKMHGHIEVVSAPGNGSSFTVSVPCRAVYRPRADRIPSQSTREQRPSRSRSGLLNRSPSSSSRFLKRLMEYRPSESEREGLGLGREPGPSHPGLGAGAAPLGGLASKGAGTSGREDVTAAMSLSADRRGKQSLQKALQDIWGHQGRSNESLANFPAAAAMEVVVEVDGSGSSTSDADAIGPIAHRISNGVLDLSSPPRIGANRRVRKSTDHTGTSPTASTRLTMEAASPLLDDAASPIVVSFPIFYHTDLSRTASTMTASTRASASSGRASASSGTINGRAFSVDDPSGALRRNMDHSGPGPHSALMEMFPASLKATRKSSTSSQHRPDGSIMTRVSWGSSEGDSSRGRLSSTHVATPRATPAGAGAGFPLVELAPILAVDDNLVNLKVLQRLLSSCGYTVETAGDGFEALRMCRDTRYSVIFMDLQMPGIDGYDTTRNIRGQPGGVEDEDGCGGGGGPGANVETPILALSANAMHDVHQRCMSAGMNGYIAKPVKLATLVESICRWTGVDPPEGYLVSEV